MKRYVADFETTTDPLDCRVWAYAHCEIGNVQNTVVGNSMDEFMQWTHKENSLVYFHNLKFDGAFLIDWLFRNGYTYSEDKRTKSFNVVISRMGAFYEISVIHQKKNRKYKQVTFNCSLKKLPFSVKEIAKAFELDLTKLKIDYKAYRPVGHIITEHEIEYIKNDVQIVAQALEIQFRQGLEKMTIGADALDNFKGYVGKQTFKINFPVLPLNIDLDIRDSYKGGFTYLNPKFKEVEVGTGVVFDVNSLYPYIMYSRWLPYGAPMKFDGQYTHDELYPLFIQNIRCEFKVKKDHIPTIQIKNDNDYVSTDYIVESVRETTLSLTSVDLQLFFDHYDIVPDTLEYLDGWKFRQCKGVFNEYIEYWSKIKIENKKKNPSLTILAKLMLNNLYGKFAKNPDTTGKYPYLDPKTNVVKYELKEQTYSEPVYTAMGAFITAYAREKTIRSGQQVYDRFIYADTDSLHLLGGEIPSNLDVHDSELGKWAHESTFIKGKFLRAKAYTEVIRKSTKHGKYRMTRLETHVTCSGMPDRVKHHVTFDTFRIGFTGTKLAPKRVVGGIVLVDSPFTLKEKIGVIN